MLLQAVLSSTYVSQNIVKPMPSLTSQSCGDSLLAVCLLGNMALITELNLSTVGHQTEAEERGLSRGDGCTFGYGTHMNC